MTLAELFKRVEGSAFEARLNVASGFRIFRLGLAEDEVTNDLIQHLRAVPQDRKKVFERLIHLLPANDQPEYAHPYDTALAGYLYALSITDKKLAYTAARQILQTPRLWWAKNLANRVQQRVLWQESPRILFSSPDPAESYEFPFAGTLLKKASFDTSAYPSQTKIVQWGNSQVDYGSGSLYHRLA